MKRLIRVISILLVFVCIFNAPVNVFAQIRKDQLAKEILESEINHTDHFYEADGSIPDNALLLRGQAAINLFEKANLDISIYSVKTQPFDTETFSVLIFNTIEERDEYVDEVNSIAKDLILPSQKLTLLISNNDMSSYKLQNANMKYSTGSGLVSDSSEFETVFYAVTLDTVFCNTCQIPQPLLTYYKFIGSVGTFLGFVSIHVHVFKELLCFHTEASSYDSQTQCPYASWCMGTAYLVQDNNGSASFACSCGAQWNIWY